MSAWKAIRWTINAQTTVVVDDPEAFTGKHVIAECDSEDTARLVSAVQDMLRALRITRDNVASLGPAGALEPHYEYRAWLRMLDEVIAKATGEQQ